MVLGVTGAFNPSLQANSYLQLTTTGDLVVWPPGQTSGSHVWAAGTSGATALTLQNDGNLVLTAASGQQVWSSNTSGNGTGMLCTGSVLATGQELWAVSQLNQPSPS